jgi:hypothetical protein
MAAEYGRANNLLPTVSHSNGYRYCPISLLRSEGTTTAWFGSFDGLATTRPLDRHSSDPTTSPLYRDLLAHYGAVALSGPGPVAPTAWGRNPPGRSATSRSTASSVCAANRACASSCSCLVCKEEQARRFRAPGRQMEELDQYIEAFTLAARSELQPRFSL